VIFSLLTSPGGCGREMCRILGQDARVLRRRDMLFRGIVCLLGFLCVTSCSRNEGSLCDVENELDFSALTADISGGWRPSLSDDQTESVRFDTRGAPISVAPGVTSHTGDFLFGCEE